MTLTACVYTKNNARVIEGAVRSLRFADEVILLDSGSSDQTVELARPFVDRIAFREWSGFRDQLEHIPTLATHDWVLIVDADERITPEGSKEILEAIKNPNYQAWFLPRMSLYMGHWLRHGEFFPDHTLRLYKKGTGRYLGEEPHARFVSDGKVGYLKEPIRHLFQRDLGEQLQTMSLYSGTQARAFLSRGGSSSARLRSLVHGVQRFFKGYIFKAGFLDGWPGFVAAVTSAFHVFIKYVRVEEEYHLKQKDEKES